MSQLVAINHWPLLITRTDSEAAAQRAVEDALLTANVRAAQTNTPWHRDR